MLSAHALVALNLAPICQDRAGEPALPCPPAFEPESSYSVGMRQRES